MLSSYSVSTGKKTHKNHTFRVPNGSRHFFPYWWCCFEFFSRGRCWVSPHQGRSFDFACCMIKPCFILCKNALKKLQCNRSWTICALRNEKIASHAVSHFNPSVPADNDICTRQSSIVDMPGIQIGCMSSTVLTVLLLSTTLHHSYSHDINILHTLSVWHTSHTKFIHTAHCDIWPHSHLMCTSQTE